MNRRLTEDERYAAENDRYYNGNYPGGINDNDPYFADGEELVLDLPPAPKQEWDEADRLRRLDEKLRKCGWLPPKE